MKIRLEWPAEPSPAVEVAYRVVCCVSTPVEAVPISTGRLKAEASLIFEVQPMTRVLFQRMLLDNTIAAFFDRSPNIATLTQIPEQRAKYLRQASRSEIPNGQGEG
jgi:hypothetical protein